jgi:hypothetical protein
LPGSLGAAKASGAYCSNSDATTAQFGVVTPVRRSLQRGRHASRAPTTPAAAISQLHSGSPLRRESTAGFG